MTEARSFSYPTCEANYRQPGGWGRVQTSSSCGHNIEVEITRSPIWRRCPGGYVSWPGEALPCVKTFASFLDGLTRLETLVGDRRGDLHGFAGSSWGLNHSSASQSSCHSFLPASALTEIHTTLDWCARAWMLITGTVIYICTSVSSGQTLSRQRVESQAGRTYSSILPQNSDKYGRTFSLDIYTKSLPVLIKCLPVFVQSRNYSRLILVLFSSCLLLVAMSRLLCLYQVMQYILNFFKFLNLKSI